MTFRRAPRPEPRQYEGKGPDMAPSPCRMADSAARLNVPVPKNPPWRSEAYRRAVANMPCAHCGKVGLSQCAHADTLGGGKGMGIKVSDALTYAACADTPRRVGCHTVLSHNLTHEHRKALETRYVDRTQIALARLLPASTEE